jgi:hypothetical protein
VDNDENEKGSRLSQWENLLADADISEVPIDFLSEISFIMIDAEVKNFNIIELLKFGLTIKEIEIKVKEFMEDFEEDIDTIDFHINVEALADAIDNKTRGLLS